MSKVQETSANNLSRYVRLRRPCVVRGLGSDLDLTRRLSEEDDDDKGVAEPTSTLTSEQSTSAIRWLSEQAAGMIFRIFVSQPVLQTGRRDDSGRRRGWVGEEGSADEKDIVGTFTLDGTDHPESVLTATTSVDATLDAVIDLGSRWGCRYVVEDELPSAGEGAALGDLVPPRPPPPAGDALASAFSESGSGTAEEPVQRQIFVAVGACRTQLHRDALDNLYVCALGTRIWTIRSPDDSIAREPGSVSASVPPPPDGTNNDGPPGSCHPLSLPPSGYARTSLGAGDAIYIPALWWHSVRSGRGASAAVNWYYRAPTAALSPPSLVAYGGVHVGVDTEGREDKKLQ